MVSRFDWGADHLTLLTIYRSLLRSKLDYGCIVYGAARKFYLRQIETIENEALRICLGAFRTSPISSLHVEANELPFHLRCIKHGLTFVLRILSDPKNPCYNIINTPRYANIFNINKHLIPPFGLRIRPHLINSKLNTSYISKLLWPIKGYWTFAIPYVYLGLSVFSKHNTNPSFFLDKYRLLKNRYTNHHFIYTDGSKTDEAVAAAAVCNGIVFSSRLPNAASIFSAEAKAILLALNFIECTFHNQFVIFSDSKSVLQAIQNLNWKCHLIYNILQKHYTTQIK